jgi:hypothetical protein
MAKPLLPASRPDPVVERYLRDVDRTLLRRNLALTPEERLTQLQELARFAEELRRAGRKARAKDLEAIAELRALLDEKPPEK